MTTRFFSALFVFLVAASSPVSYFKFERPVQVAAGGQHYLVVDETIWRNAQPDLADLRLFASQSELPYALVIEQGATNRERTPVPVLQQSTVAGKTQFLIDMSEMVEYNRVDLTLATKNFVAHARVEGQDDPHGRAWAALGDSILYDFTKENLGNNNTLRLPRSTYKYLRVTLDGPVKPEDVQGATSEVGEDQPPRWRDLNSAAAPEQKGKDTIFTFHVPDNVPVERVAFAVDPAQPNFWRKVELQDEKNTWLGSGDINRIHMQRAGQKIDSELQEVQFTDTGRAGQNTVRAGQNGEAGGQNTIRVIIHNGDDPPLKVTGAHLQQLERRIYFDATAKSDAAANPDTAPNRQLTLYYGDPKLQPPVYDYARLFQRDKAATLATLGQEISNPAYTPRQDDRAWSERHPVVLWTAILAAVLLLGGVALRSVITATRRNT